MVILGINGALDWDGNNNEECGKWVHGSGATLIVDGEWKGSSCEERFSRIKYDGNFPIKTIENLLSVNNLTFNDVNVVSYVTSIVNQVFVPKHRYKINFFLQQYFKNAEILINNHHEAHALSSFLTSPFEESNILTLDGCGDVFVFNKKMQYNHGCFGYGKKDPFEFRKYETLYYDDDDFLDVSIGDFYTSLSSIILDIQFKDDIKKFFYHDNNKIALEGSAGKVMGLAAYGKPIDLTKNIFKMEQPSSYEMPKISYVFNIKNYSFVNQLHQYKAEDLALWTQQVFEEAVMSYIDKIPKSLKTDYLCFGGGCALNISLNSKIIKEGLYKDIHVPTAPNDEGLSLGGALHTAYLKNIKVEIPKNIGCVGLEYKNFPKFNYEASEAVYFDKMGLVSKDLKYEDLYDEVSTLLLNNKIVAWFQGKSEFGPRALCNRSILANPCFDNKQTLNEKVKFREYWRPYAAVVMQEHLDEWFDCPKKDSHYMLFNSFVKEDKIKFIPGVVHIDKTCRIQTVNSEINDKAYNLVNSFFKKSKIPLLLNTSFNTIPGEPIVETPEDAINSFINSNIDALVINNKIITRKNINETYSRKEQPLFIDTST